MSAQLTLTDGEMEAIIEQVRRALEGFGLSDEERGALERAGEKLRRGLQRPGVRYPKMRRP